MPKLGTLAFGTVGVLAAAWSGGWYYGESKIRAGIDDEIARMAQRGVAARYQSVDIGGFPFAYRGKVVEPRTEAISLIGKVQARTDWRAPWISFETSLGDLGVINFALPEKQTVRLTPVRGGPMADIEILSTQFEGSLQRESAGARITAEGRDIEVKATSQVIINPLELKVESVSIDSSAPLQEPGQIKAAANLSGLTASEGIWGFFDPGQRFPRDPANLSLVANADTALRDDQTLAVQSLNIEQIEANVAGVELSGDGQAVVKDHRPDGTLDLRLSGLNGFFDSAIAGGILPEQQAALYRIMVNSFAKKGESEGEQVFTIGFKGGMIFVNDRPTFIPTPLLP